MRTALLAALAVAALAATACDSGGGETTTASTTPAAAPPAPPPPPPPPAPTSLPGLSEPYATEADWAAACTTEGKIDKTVCECAGKAITADQGQKAYYQWAWEAYINRTGMGSVRAKKWFTDNGMDTKAEQKFASALGKCFVTQ
jgi:invasion protein IalB